MEENLLLLLLLLLPLLLGHFNNHRRLWSLEVVLRCCNVGGKSPDGGMAVITSQISVGERNHTDFVFHSGIINDLNLAASSNIIKIPKFNVVNRFMHKEEACD